MSCARRSIELTVKPNVLSADSTSRLAVLLATASSALPLYRFAHRLHLRTARYTAPFLAAD